MVKHFWRLQNVTTTVVDFLIIGGGVIGLNLAITAKQRHPDCKVMLIEKEIDCGLHASGRNSGVLHAGFYYTPDSLKAGFTRKGNQLLTEYCLDRGLHINQCGKLVVTKNEHEENILSELLQRGIANGVELYRLSKKEAQEIEPRAKTWNTAIYSPSTASVDPREVMASTLDDARNAGVIIRTGTQYLRATKNQVRTNHGHLTAAYIINASGLYADNIARDFGFSENYRILPFKGLYLYSDEPPGTLRTNIYPVPNLSNPFLGVHFTLTVEGKSKIGPTAIPAFWREHYNGLSNFKFSEMTEIMGREIALLIRNDFDFRSLALQESAKYFRGTLVKLAAELSHGVRKSDFKKWGAPGIRAQLFDVKNRCLEMDFHFEGDQNSFHVLNAVSPAFTCAIPFSRYLFDQIDNLITG